MSHSLPSTSRTSLPQVRILLTGTPVQNDMVELWSLCNFIMPQVRVHLCSTWLLVVAVEPQHRHLPLQLLGLTIHIVLLCGPSNRLTRYLLMLSSTSQVFKSKEEFKRIYTFMGMGSASGEWRLAQVTVMVFVFGAIIGYTVTPLVLALRRCYVACVRPVFSSAVCVSIRRLTHNAQARSTSASKSRRTPSSRSYTAC